MRLIFVSWAFPPMNFPRAIQVERLASHIAIRPLEIFCASIDGDAGSVTADTSGIAIRRIPEPRPSRLYGRLGLARVRAALTVPDARRAWAARAAREIARNPLGRGDVLVTFGQPMSDHIAGLELTARFGNRWIAHFSDPWADNPFAARMPFSRRRNLGWERDVIGAADFVLMTSHETRDLVMRKYPPAWRSKVCVLPHAFAPSLYPPRERANGPVVVRYLGSLYGPRGPFHFLRGLEILAQRAPEWIKTLRVEFIGDVAPQHTAGAARANVPPGVIRFVPAIDYRSSLAMMRSADLLLHLDAPAAESVFLASKLVDYIGARRPILGITPTGTAAQLIAALGGRVADPTMPEQVAAALAGAIDDVCRDRDSDWGNGGVRRGYEITTVAQEFAQIVERVRGT